MIESARASLKTKRILMKLSGELLADSGSGTPLHEKGLDLVANHIATARDAGAEVAVVLGGGNIHRGTRSLDRNYPRDQSDEIGMVGTLVNALAVKAELNLRGIPTHVLNAWNAPRVAELHYPGLARKYLSRGNVVLFSGGTGNPYFTTDTAAALRGIETECNLLIKGTKVDGVYSADPNRDSDARLIDSLTFEDVIDGKLGVMDLTAATLCMENRLPVVVLNALTEASIKGFFAGENIGTLVLPADE